MKKELSERIRFIGFVMTCGMVLYHLPVVGNEFCVNRLDLLVNTVFTGIIKEAGTLEMSWFFTVTGFLLYCNYSIRSYTVKLKRRVFSLLIPYLLWQLIFWAVELLLGNCDFSIADFLRRTLLFVRWPVNGPMWYVYAVFWLSLVSPIIFLLIKNKKIGWIAVMALILLFGMNGRIDSPVIRRIVAYGYMENIVSYFPAYLTGAFFGFHFKDKDSDCLWYLLSAIIIAFLADRFADGVFEHLTVLFIPTALLYLLPEIKVIENKGFGVTRLSFLMYVLHIPLLGKLHPYVLTAYMFTVKKICPSAAVGTIVICFLLLAVDILAAALIYKVLSKKAPRVLALLTGGRG